MLSLFSIAHCNPPCSPEGRCVEPNVCACPSGLYGKQCEKGEQLIAVVIS